MMQNPKAYHSPLSPPEFEVVTQNPKAQHSLLSSAVSQTESHDAKLSALTYPFVTCGVGG